MTSTRNIGRIEAIHIAPAATGEMLGVEQSQAIAGNGLAGDRYAAAAGTFSTWPKDHEFTLIEAEAIEAMNHEHGIALAAGATRRNVTTRGIFLNDWIGKEFTIGQAVCRATRFCPPCAHLQKLLGIENLMRIMEGRGGIRAQIIKGGTIHVGDAITLCV